MRHGHLLHSFIRDRIETRLRGRSWAWLARQAGIPQSTLATQKSIPKFSIATLVSVAEALEEEVSFFLPPAHSIEADRHRAAIDEIERIVRDLREG